MRTAMPCPAGRHESAIPCSPPTNPTGFIYPSYRAAQTETQRDEASLKTSHQGVAYVSSSVGGSLSSLSFEDTKASNRLSSPTGRGGGIRDRVKGFSRVSRTNLLRRLASINRGAFRAFKGRIIFVTLTYPHEYPDDPKLCKHHLKALRKRLQREFGTFAAFWRLGIQMDLRRFRGVFQTENSARKGEHCHERTLPTHRSFAEKLSGWLGSQMRSIPSPGSPARSVSPMAP
jgi:hypothetical protein